MANEVIGIEVAVKLDQLRAQLATLGPGMEKEAAAMTAALNKQLKAQTAAVKKQTAAMVGAQRSSVKQLGDEAAAAGTKFDKLAKAAGPLGGVLSRISPEAGAVASSLAGITGAAEGVAAGVGVSLGAAAATLGLLALALAPVIGGFVVMQREARFTAERLEFVERHANDLDGVLRRLETAELAAAVASGELSEELAKIVRIQSGTTAGAEEYAKAQEAERAAANEAFFAAERRMAQLAVLPGFLSTAADYYMGYTRTQAESLKTVKALDDGEREHTVQLYKVESALVKTADAEEERGKKGKKESAARAERDAKAAAQAEYDTERLIDEMQRVDEHRAAYGAKQLARVKEEAAATARAEAYVAKLVEENAAAKIEAAEKTKRAAEDIASAVMGAISNVMDAIGTFASLAADATASAATKAADRLDNLRDLLSDLRAETVDAATLSGDALVQAFKRGEVSADELSEAQKESIDAVLSAAERAAAKRAKVERKAAIEAFDTQQAVNIASAIAAGALAVIQAFAQLGPIAGGIAAVGIAATTAASIASIEAAKPSFHRGGIVSEAGQGEVSARLLPNEAVLNRQAADSLGAGGVHALNAGASMGGVSLRIGRLEAREIVRTDIAAGGLIVRTAKAAAATGGNTAGRTGRRPIA